MAADEDTELRDLVAQTLEANGVLGRIRAQLRSSVFLALEEQDSLQDKPMFVNKDLKKFLTTKDGQLVTGLVREFLEFFNLEFSLAVFDPESGYTTNKPSRTWLARECGLSETDKPPRNPLLVDLVKKSHGPSLTRMKSADEDTDEGYVRVKKELGQKDLVEARKKFEHYDADRSGYIDQNELRNLFSDLFPHFHKNMLDRYVMDEFKAADKDLSNGIDFDEFAGMYKRLFILCRSVVSEDVTGLISPHSQSQSLSHPTTSKKTASAGGASTVEQKNKKNRSTSDKAPAAQQVNGDCDGSEPEDDPFFDDPLPKSDRSERFTKNRKPDENSSRTNQSKNAKQNSTDQSSLQGLPTLSDRRRNRNSEDDDISIDIKAIDKRIKDIGFDAGDDDDYDDDFMTNSNLSASHKLSVRSGAGQYNSDIPFSRETGEIYFLVVQQPQLSETTAPKMGFPRF